MSWAKKPKRVPVNGRGSDVSAPGKVRGRDRHGVDKRAPAEQTGERVGQRIADADVMHTALRGNIDRGIGSTSAEVIFAIGADTEVGGVAVQADLAPHFEGMAAWW